MRKIIQPLKSNWKFILAVIIGAFLWSLIPKCSQPEPIQTNPLKTKIQANIKAGEVLKAVEKKSDSVRTITIIKWKQAKETIKYLPCDSAIKIIVAVCDTVFKADSVEIVNLKNIISNKDTTIKDLFILHQNDSTVIVGKDKTIRKLKRQKWWLKAGLAGAFGLAVFRH